MRTEVEVGKVEDVLDDIHRRLSQGKASRFLPVFGRVVHVDELVHVVAWPQGIEVATLSWRERKGGEMGISHSICFFLASSNNESHSHLRENGLRKTKLKSQITISDDTSIHILTGVVGLWMGLPASTSFRLGLVTAAMAAFECLEDLSLSRISRVCDRVVRVERGEVSPLLLLLLLLDK